MVVRLRSSVRYCDLYHLLSRLCLAGESEHSGYYSGHGSMSGENL